MSQMLPTGRSKQDVPGAAASAVVRDDARLAALRGTHLLDSAAEPAFDRLTRLAVRLLGVPSAFFSLVDETRDFYKSACGFPEPLASGRELTGPTFCHYAIQSRAPLVIPDTAADPVYREVPTVRTLGVAAYVGVPIAVDGQVIGSFCVIDVVPHAWTASEVEILTELAASAEREIGLRSALELAEQFAGQLEEQAAELETQQAELEQQVEEATTLSDEAHALAEELRESTVELESERRRLADVFARAPSFLAMLRGRSHVFTRVNEAYTQLVGGRDVVGKALLEALPELRGQTMVELIDRVLDTGQRFVGREMPLTVTHEAGAEPEQRFVDFVYQPWVESGERVGVIAHGMDVTESVLARREVERLLGESERARAEADEARAVAEQANRSQAAFLGTMSHEFRTPLNAIAGYAQLLDLEIGGPLTAGQRDHLTRLRASNTHMLGLVNDVLDLAKLDAGALAVRVDAASAGVAAVEALSLIRPQADTRGVRLVDEMGGAAVPFVGDEDRVRQVLVNLLSNAVKFSAPGAEVFVGCRRVETTPAATRLTGAGPWAVLDVRDHGVGIAPEHQAAVFEAFQQVENGRTRTRGGTGLGLAISRRLTRLMGGDLTLESAVGTGSTFSVWLPALSAAPVASAAAESTHARSTRAKSAAPGRPAQSLAGIGRRLREELEPILEAWMARLRADGAFPSVRTLSTSQLEDHTLPFLSNVVQTLVIVEQTGGLESDLLADSMAIQRVTCEYHGRQRRRIGWTEAEVTREFTFLIEELSARVRRFTVAGSEDAALALGILERVIAKAREAAVGSLRGGGRQD